MVLLWGPRGLGEPLPSGPLAGRGTLVTAAVGGRRAFRGVADFWCLFAWGPLTAAKRYLMGVVRAWPASSLLGGHCEPAQWWEGIRAVSASPHRRKLGHPSAGRLRWRWPSCPLPTGFLLISDELRVRESLSQRLFLRETKTLSCLLPRKACLWGKELWSGGGELG